MSQAGPLDAESSNPQIPTSFTTDSGVAIPVGNNLNVFGQNVSGSGIQTSGAGATVSLRMLSPYSLSNFTFSNATLATKRIVLVTNTAADTLSDSVLRVNVSGSNTSDPYIQVGQDATNIFCWGTDTSDSNTLKICQDANSNAATPSGGTLLYSLTTAGAGTYHQGNLSISRATGSTVALNVINSAGLTGDAQVFVQTESTNPGDPKTVYAINGGSSWASGIDNSNSDAYSISSGTTLGTTECLRISTALNVTIPSGNLLVSRSNVGGDVTIQSINDDNTNTSSQATIQVRSNGASAGDARFLWTINGVRNWIMGIDNSDSDKLKMELGAAIGTNPFFEIDPTALAPTFLSGSSGTPFQTVIKHTQNSAASDANLLVNVAGTSAGDPYTTYTVTSGSSWSNGVDNSDSDAYVLAASTALGTTNVMRASTAGEINYPLQPAFLARLAASLTDVTGDGTLYTILFDTEAFDQNNDFNTSTGVFTAPVTGRYIFTWNLSIQGLTSSHTQLIVFLNSSFASNTQVARLNPAQIIDSGEYHVCGSLVIPLTASQTCSLQLQVSGSTKVVDIGGTLVNGSYFGGYLFA